jgi:hypothetical protein
MIKLFEKKPKRLFTFGCSFTGYNWGTWPMILGYDLDIPYWNYGHSGGGNQFMIAMMIKADLIHKFTEDDLIIISWTNVCREDRFVKGNWVTPGNIFSQNIYDDEFLMKYVDPLGYMIRDLTSIRLVKEYLKSKNCQFHFLAMCNIVEKIDQGSNRKLEDNTVLTNIKKLFSEELSLIRPSFYKVLWNDDIHKYKFEKDLKRYPYLNDGHPTPEEHFIYLQKTFNHVFRDDTFIKMQWAQKNFKNFMLECADSYKRSFTVYELNDAKQKELISITTIKYSEHVDKEYDIKDL